MVLFIGCTKPFKREVFDFFTNKRCCVKSDYERLSTIRTEILINRATESCQNCFSSGIVSAEFTLSVDGLTELLSDNVKELVIFLFVPLNLVNFAEQIV